MALVRRSGARFEQNIWPGFVDALTALLLILMFVLSIFMIVQFSLRETITGQDQRLIEQEQEIIAQEERIDALSSDLAALSEVLALERDRSAVLEGQVGELRASLSNQEAEADRLSAALAAMTQARDAAEARVVELSTSLSESQDAEAALSDALAAARDEIDAQTEAARLAAARRQALEAMIARLNEEADVAADAIAKLETDRSSALAMIAQLRQEAAEDAAARAELETARTDLEAERAELTQLLATLRDRNTALAEDLETVRSDLSEEEKLREEIAALYAAARERLETAETALTAEEEARLIEAAAAAELRRKLEEQSDELDTVTLALEEARREAEETLTLLAAARAAASELGEVEDEAARRARLLRIAETELARAKQATLAEARKVERLNIQIRELRTQLASLQGLLDAAEERDEEQKVQIEQLGEKLNAALAQKVSELARFRSVFFEKMEQVLGGRQDIRRVGDRFVFESEVLFSLGSAQLGAAGRQELSKLGEVLRALEGEVPEDVDWILRVDGHTDKQPYFGQFGDNLGLSAARALSVVRYLIENEGIPPERLAATGFGETRPIDPGESPEAYAQNRRIEFKFTER